LISAVAAHWNVPVYWLDIQEIPLFHRDRVRAAARDEPFAHPYEMWHRALARGARAVGSHVAFDGIGGDQLFQVSDVYLADLMAHGRWIATAREWRAKGLAGSGWRNFFRLAIQPRLSPSMLRLAAALRGGRPLPGYLERLPPAWCRPDFVRRHALVERERESSPPRRGRSCAAHETRWYLTYPYFARIFGCVAALNAEEGVEARSPLYDQRVIDFALSRPRHERSHGRETKRLLRRAVHGLLPEHVLAARAARTGVTSGYFDRSMREGFAGLASSSLSHQTVLEELGIIDGDALRESIAHYDRHRDGDVGVRLYFTLQTELWLRAQRGDYMEKCSGAKFALSRVTAV
jgi:asparagine synthase (glutamine-hydrolysing)